MSIWPTGLRSVYHFLGGAVISSPAMAAVEVEGDLGTGLEGGAAPASPGGHTAEFWDLVNQGPGGIGVLKRIRPTNTIGVGELLAIQFPLRGQSGTDWSIGTVRWLSIGNGGDYHAGVQILAKSATAVSIEASTDGGEPRTSGAIAVPGIPSDKAGALITPTGFYAPQKPLVVNTPGGPLRVVPESLIESTTAYDRFSYRIDS